MDNNYYNNLIKRVLQLSVHTIWDLAVREWVIVDCEVDEDADSKCVCGKENLKYLFTIQNRMNGNILYPIGSTCIMKFGRPDLDLEISVYNDMIKLLDAVKKNKFIQLTSEFFSRNLLLYLYNEGAFKPTHYNNFNPSEDYYFMLDMFNKRKKEDIFPAQRKKINAIIFFHIIPFLKQKIKDTRVQ